MFEDLGKASLGVALATSVGLGTDLNVDAGLGHFTATDPSLNVSAVNLPGGQILFDLMGLGALIAVTGAALQKVFEADAK